MIFSHDPNRARGVRGALHSSDQQTLGQRLEIKSAVEAASTKQSGNNTWTTGENSATLSGAGVGLNWSGPDQWGAKMHVATPVGSPLVLVGNTNSTRAWVEVSRQF